MSRFAAKISSDNLNKILTAADVVGESIGETKLAKDLSKVRFDRENFEPEDRLDVEGVINVKGGIYLVGDLTFALFYAGGRLGVSYNVCCLLGW